MRLFVTSVLGTVLTFTCSAASAQDSGGGTTQVQDFPQASFWEGGGVKLTEGSVFHPAFDLQTGYQTNVFYQNAADSPGPIGAVISRIGVSGTWESVSRQRMELEAPDNGVLTRVLEGRSIHRAAQLSEPRFWRKTVSQTFHGRDIFGPVAAHWGLGVDLAEFGPPLDKPRPPAHS